MKNVWRSGSAAKFYAMPDIAPVGLKSIDPGKAVKLIPRHPTIRYHQQYEALIARYRLELQEEEKIANQQEKKTRLGIEERAKERHAKMLQAFKLQELYNEGIFARSSVVAAMQKIDYNNFYAKSRLAERPKISTPSKTTQNEKMAGRRLAHLAQIFHISADFVTASNIEEKLDVMFYSSGKTPAHVPVSSSLR